MRVEESVIAATKTTKTRLVSCSERAPQNYERHDKQTEDVSLILYGRRRGGRGSKEDDLIAFNV